MSLPERIVELFSTLHTQRFAALIQLRELYALDISFADPIQNISGRDAFIAMNKRLIEKFADVRFEDVTWVGDENRFMLTWRMRLLPKRGPEMVFEGSSDLRARDGKIYYHRDYWDLLGGVMGALPMVAPVYARIVAHLG